MDGLEAYKEISHHMMGYTIQDLPQLGYFHANCEDQIMLVWGTKENQYGIQEGRWLIRYQGEHSYVSPQLFKLVSDYVHDEICGQTMRDGTIMSLEKSKQLASQKKTTHSNDACDKKEDTSSIDHTPNQQQPATSCPTFEKSGSKGIQASSRVRTLHSTSGVKKPRGVRANKTRTTRTPGKKTNSVRDPVDGGCGIKEINQSKIKEEDVAVRGTLNKETMNQKITKLYIKNKVKLEEEGGDAQSQPQKGEVLVDERGYRKVEEHESSYFEQRHIEEPPRALSYYDHQRASSIGKAKLDKLNLGDEDYDECEQELYDRLEIKDFTEEIGVDPSFTVNELLSEEDDIRRSCVEVNFY
jgi:hypothetical protein